MKLRRPDKIAICFVDGNMERTFEQVKQLEGIEEDFIVEWNYRASKFSGPYSNFSQLVNEAVVETQSEFMVFINPKTNINRSDVNTLIDDLCNGFAWSSICSFGFWATTKELFRRIGMMDERFIGSEYEDNDFAFRMKAANLAINWRFELSQYPWKKPILPQMRGATATLFPTKWYNKDGVYYRTDLFIEEKRLPLHIQSNTREDIHRSWMDWSSTQSDNISHVFHQANEAIISNKIARSRKIKADIKIELTREGGLLKSVFMCDVPTEIQLTLTNAIPIGEERLVPDENFMLYSNHWYTWGPLEKRGYDLRFFHEGRLILNDTNYRFPESREYIMGINITEFSIDSEIF